MTKLAKPVDFIGIWAGVRLSVGQKSGFYPGLFDQGAPVPRLTLTQTREMQKSLRLVADELFKTLTGRGRARELGLITDAKREFLNKSSDIILEYSHVPLPVRYGAPGTQSGTYVWYPTAKEFWRATSQFVMKLNGVSWSAAGGIESFFERIDMYMPAAVKPFYKAGLYTAKYVPPALEKAWDATRKSIQTGLGIAAFLMSVAPYALALGLGYITFKEFDKRR